MDVVTLASAFVLLIVVVSNVLQRRLELRMGRQNNFLGCLANPSVCLCDQCGHLSSLCRARPENSRGLTSALCASLRSVLPALFACPCGLRSALSTLPVLFALSL